MTVSTLQITRPDPELARASGSWVDASPFRAHLRHLMGSANLTAVEVALLAGLTPRFAASLLGGRRGRVVRRINPQQASRLLLLTPDDVSRAARREVLAGLARRPARRLQAAGWELDEVASQLGLSCSDLTRLLEGRMRVCPQLVAVRATAAALLLGIALPEEFDEATSDEVLDLAA